MIKLKSGLAGKRRFNSIIMPVTLKIIFSSLDIYNVIFYGTMFMTGNNIMKQLLRRNA